MIGLIVGFIVVEAWTGSWVLGLVAGVLFGLASVWAHPITRCGWCALRGGPRYEDRSGKNWREVCWRCGGSGKRVRFLTRYIGGWGVDRD